MSPVSYPAGPAALQSPSGPLRQPGPTAGPSNVPPLNDRQKKILAEFNSKLSALPAQDQAAYIAQNKKNLIKQLNVQPNQLRILQTSQVPAQPPQPLVRPQQRLPSHGKRTAMVESQRVKVQPGDLQNILYFFF